MHSFCPLLDEYLNLVDDTEPPILYHRWCMLANVAAITHRRSRIAMATGDIYPNIYMILIGPPAARKSTAINMATGVLKASGYGRIASGKTTPQKFLTDLAEGFDNINSLANSGELDLDLDLEPAPDIGEKVSDVLISAGELQDFFGINNFDFITLITNLFDNLSHYDYRIKSDNARLKEAKRILNPTLSLVGGATNTSFKKMFPLDILGQGLLSRFVLVHGAGPRSKIFMPKSLDEGDYKAVAEHLRAIRLSNEQPSIYEFNKDAFEYSKSLYESTKDEIPDPRFQHYNNRRNIHYMKLAMLVAVANMHKEIELDDCIVANTILSYTEKFMPKALGEFGLDKDAEVTDMVYDKIAKSPNGVTLKTLLSSTIASVGSYNDLSSHLIRLHATNRIDRITDDSGGIKYIPISRVVDTKSKMVDYSILREYQTNPTFDTAFKSDPTSEIEYDIKLEAEKLNTTTQFEVLQDEQP